MESAIRRFTQTDLECIVKSDEPYTTPLAAYALALRAEMADMTLELEELEARVQDDGRKIKYLRDRLAAIPSVDKTPPYKARVCNPNGERPGKGYRWATPTEIAFAALRTYDPEPEPIPRETIRRPEGTDLDTLRSALQNLLDGLSATKAAAPMTSTEWENVEAAVRRLPQLEAAARAALEEK